MIGRRRRPAVPVGAGERVLAAAETEDGQRLAGTRDAFYAAGPEGDVVRIPWEQVEAAEWDREAGVLRIAQVGAWGEQRPVHVFTVDDPRRLLQLVRERVTASVVLQRHVPVDGRRGVRVIARRAPRGDQPVHWVYEYDQGVDPEDPRVRDLAARALAEARADLGVA